MAPKPEIIISLELWQIAYKYLRQIRDFRWCRARQTISHMIATTTDCHKLQYRRAKRPYCNFRLSVVVAVARRQFLRTGRGRKSMICRWNNCHPICHSSRDISISGYVGLIAISGYPSMSDLFVGTFFEFGVVDNFVYRARITVILTSDLFACMSLRLWLLVGAPV